MKYRADARVYVHRDIPAPQRAHRIQLRSAISRSLLARVFVRELKPQQRARARIREMRLSCREARRRVPSTRARASSRGSASALAVRFLASRIPLLVAPRFVLFERLLRDIE